MIIMKFGGSSLANAERIRHVVDIIKMYIDEKPLIVASAMGDTTDNLLEAVDRALAGKICIKDIRKLHLATAEELEVNPDVIKDLFDELKNLLSGIALIKEFSPRTRDYLVSFGERLSVRLISGYLNRIGVEARFFDAWDVGFTSNNEHNNGEILEESYARIDETLGHLADNYAYTPIITGFIAKCKNGNITTLGRGGSDLTASVLGAALRAKEIQVWKDVDGILTTDPRIVKTARPVSSISFEEASELAYFGAKVLHPRSIIPAMCKKIPVRVKNSYNPTHPGTLILSMIDDSSEMLRVLTFKKKVTVVDIVSTRMLGQYGFLAKVFQIFDEHKVSVDMLATSEVSISLTLDNRENGLEGLEMALDKIANVTIKKGKTIVTMVGNVKRSSEILERTFEVLNASGINVQMISQGASKVNISFIVDDSEADTCIRELHRTFFETA
ncbi:MAG: aspartate kinase [Candidatus Riflebacteria bacterium HGW-Riflebacteria-2]|nr:MAG: aspartate kinase [Candidatus Riflebacteria bacterium HGW-Riflebacteria-2]